MCFPSVAWSSVTLVTPNENRNMVQITVLKYPLGSNLARKLSKMFSKVEIEIL